MIQRFCLPSCPSNIKATEKVFDIQEYREFLHLLAFPEESTRGWASSNQMITKKKSAKLTVRILKYVNVDIRRLTKDEDEGERLM